MNTIPGHTPIRAARSALPLLALAGALLIPGIAAAKDGAKSFVDDFDGIDKARWYVSDGWNNGAAPELHLVEEAAEVAGRHADAGFREGEAKDRDYACAEIQTKQRFSYGTYEARMKTDGSGLNAAFFTYIGPADKQPHDEIDFEVLTKDSFEGAGQRLHLRQGGNNEKLVDVKGGADGGFNDYAFVWKPDSGSAGTSMASW